MKAAAITIIAIGGGLFAWAIGSRLSTDAVGMGIGLIFGALAGVMAGMPVGWALRTQPARGSYDDGVEAGRLEAHREMLEYEGQKALRQVPTVIVVNPPAPQYTLARPFALGGATVDGEVVR